MRCLQHLLLLAALAAACLVQHIQAAQIPPERRAVVGDTDGVERSPNLDRRWWFGWSGALMPAGPRDEDVKVITRDGVVHHIPASDAAYVRMLERLARKHPEIIHVEIDGPGGAKVTIP